MPRKFRTPSRHTTGSVTAYCVKCKTNDRPMIDCTKTTTVRGQPMMKGKCGVCNAGMCKFMKK